MMECSHIVVSYIRPAYKREFVYNLEQAEAVIHTVFKGISF